MLCGWKRRDSYLGRVVSTVQDGPDVASSPEKHGLEMEERTSTVDESTFNDVKCRASIWTLRN